MGLSSSPCFSKEYNKRNDTYMNEELTIAIEEATSAPTDRVWFIPVQLNKCKIPDRNIGGGETLHDLQHVKLYKDWDDGIGRIIEVIQSESPESTRGGNTDSKSSGNFADQNSKSAKRSQPNGPQNRELTDWVFQQADDLIKSGEIDKALKGYSHGINLDPHRPFAYNNRGAAYNIKGDVDNAINRL